MMRSCNGSREYFEQACRVAHIRPRVLLESGAPHTVVALAAAGYGLAIAPSNAHILRPGVRALPLVQSRRRLVDLKAARRLGRSAPPHVIETVLAPFVIVTFRSGDTCRIISARKATRHEQDRYYAGRRETW